MKRCALIFIFLLFPYILISQGAGKGTISGFVYDENTGEGLIGANVFLEGTYFGSSTNHAGFYSLPRVNAGNYNLICQYIGYKTYIKSIAVRAGEELKVEIRLEPTTIETEEVFVIADSVRTSIKLYNKSISKIDIKPRQLERITQVIETDLLRSLQSMPGIAAVSDFSSELYVRGGTPDQNLYLIDGSDVYNPEHFFGLFSTFNTDAIKNVEISKGGFGAEYGGRLSSILDVTNLDGNRREFKNKTSISLLSAKTTTQIPLGDLGAISGSIRRTYFDKTIGQYNDDIPDYYFIDGHLKAYLDLNENNKLTISTYISNDELDLEFAEDTDNPAELFYNWGNTTGSVRWTHIFSSSLFGNFWVTGSSFDSDFDFQDFKEDNDIKDFTLKGDLEYYYSQKFNSKIGFEFKKFTGEFKQIFPGGNVIIKREPKYYSGYLQNVWRPSPLLELQAGLRFNYFESKKNYYDLDPRFSIKYRLTETVNLKGAFGKYHQYLFRVPRTFIADIWTSSDENYGSASANHYIVGIQRELSKDFEFELETYYKDYRNLYSYSYFFYIDLRPTYYNSKGEPVYTTSDNIFDTGEGSAYGVELLFRKDTGPLSGWLSYTLGRTTRTIEGVNSGEEFVPRHDRTSTFNVVADLDIRNSLRQMRGRNMHSDRTTWRFGFGFVYATGQPLTTTSSVYVTRPLPNQDYYSGYNLYPTERNNFRLPPYIRMDMSITMEKKYKNWTLRPFIQVFNVLNRENVWFITYDDELINNKIIQNIETTSMLPIIPTIGVTALF